MTAKPSRTPCSCFLAFGGGSCSRRRGPGRGINSRESSRPRTFALLDHPGVGVLSWWNGRIYGDSPRCLWDSLANCEPDSSSGRCRAPGRRRAPSSGLEGGLCTLLNLSRAGLDEDSTFRSSPATLRAMSASGKGGEHGLLAAAALKRLRWYWRCYRSFGEHSSRGESAMRRRAPGRTACCGLRSVRKASLHLEVQV